MTALSILFQIAGESVHFIRIPGLLLYLQHVSGHHLKFPPPHYDLELTHRG